MKKLAITAAVVATWASPALAASGNTSTASGSASATIVNPIVLTHTSGAALGFGKFTRGTGGTVVVTAGGSGSVTADVGFVPGSTTSADAFTVAGDASRSFAITTTSGTVTFGAGNSMAFTTTPSAATATTSAAGAASFTVGGTLTVGGAQVAGAYTGTYNATVTYN